MSPTRTLGFLVNRPSGVGGEQDPCSLSDCGRNPYLKERGREREFAGNFHLRRPHCQGAGNMMSHRREAKSKYVVVPLLVQAPDLANELTLYFIEVCFDAPSRFVLCEAVRNSHVKLCHFDPLSFSSILVATNSQRYQERQIYFGSFPSISENKSFVKTCWRIMRVLCNIIILVSIYDTFRTYFSKKS